MVRCPQRRAAARARIGGACADRAASVITPAQRRPSLHAPGRTCSRRTSIRLVRDQGGEPVGQRAGPSRCPRRARSGARMASLQPERELAVRLGVEADALRAEATRRPPEPPPQGFERPSQAEPAPGGQRVGRVAVGRVVGGERGREPALRPEARALLERLARDQEHVGADLGHLARSVKARGAAADDHNLGSSRSRREGSRGEVRYPRHLVTTAPADALAPSSLEHETGAHPENAARVADRGRARGPRGGARAAGGARGHARAAERVTAPPTSTRSRSSALGWRDDRHGHGRVAGVLGGGPARRRRRVRRPSGSWPARAERRLLRPAATGASRGAGPGDGVLPVQRRRRRLRARDRRGGGREGPGPRLGRPPRQRHGGDLRGLRSVLYASIHQWPLYPGTGRRTTKEDGEGYTVNLPVDPGAESRGSWRSSSTSSRPSRAPSSPG